MDKSELRKLFLATVYEGVAAPIETPLRFKAVWCKKECRYCGKEVKQEDSVVTYSYWNALLAISHKECKEEGFKEEAYECQKIDANCNECKHFIRGAKANPTGHYGMCGKFNKAVVAHSNNAQGNDCFIHRRD